MKKITKHAIIIFLFVLIIFGIATIKDYVSSIDVRDEAKLIEFVKSNAYSVRWENESRLESVSLLVTLKEDGYFYALFLNGKTASPELMVFKQNSFLTNRYHYRSGSLQSGDISIHNMMVDKSLKKSLVIIYGDNRLVGAYSYEFYHHGKRYTKTYLGEYILDAYVFEEPYEYMSELKLFGINGDVLNP